MYIRRFVSLIAFCCCAFQAMGAVKVESYSYPADIEISSRYEMSVAGKNVTVLYGPEADYAIFGASGEVEVCISLMQGSADSLIVRPQAKNYKYGFIKDQIRLTLKTGDRVSVELNKSTAHPLFIFVNPLEEAAAAKAAKDPDTRFFAAGKIYDIGKLDIFSGQTVYIQGGAIVKGNTLLRERSNVTVCGCGIFDSRQYDGKHHPKQYAMYNVWCSNFKMENVTVLNEDWWTLFLVRCDNLLLRNVKVIAFASHIAHGAGCENDAFDICSCQNARIEGCFGYCHDDVFCVKSYTPICTRLSKDNFFKDCVAWNVGAGNSTELGYGTAGDMENIFFEDIYAIHSGRSGQTTFRRSGLGIHEAQGGTIRNVSYRNIHIEDPLEHSLYIGIFKSPYPYEWKPGSIENVTIDGLYLYRKAPLGAVIQGHSEGHKVKGVSIRNYYLEGKRQSNLEPVQLQYNENVTIQ